MTMPQFANHVISVARDSVGGISNLQLQKVIYFTLGQYIRDNGIDDLVEEIYTERFEAWQYGPVIRSEYFRNKEYGRYRIRRDTEINPQYHDFNGYIRDNAKRSVSELVDDSHSRPTWYKNREAILSNERIFYSLEDLENDFR